MPDERIARARLQSHRLLTPTPGDLPDVLAHMLALQSQDLPAALWAIALRAPHPPSPTNPTSSPPGLNVDHPQTSHTTAAAPNVDHPQNSDPSADPAAPAALTVDHIRTALDQGQLLRTHVLRPTWHIVTPQDIHWLLNLTGERILRATAPRRQQLGLTDPLLHRAAQALTHALTGGISLTRPEIAQILTANRITLTGPQAHSHLLMALELQGILVSGVTRTSPTGAALQTYALLAERAPTPTHPLTHQQSLAELARRYITSHGPATERDLAWWSGLPLTTARTALTLAGDVLERAQIGGKLYWQTANPPTSPAPSAHQPPPPLAHLLPAFDEYVVAYTDRTAIHDDGASRLKLRGGVLSNVILLRGIAAGSWSRAFTKPGIELSLWPLHPLSTEERAALQQQAEAYARFWQRPLARLLWGDAA